MDDRLSTRLAIWCIGVFVFLSGFGIWEAIYSNNGSPYDRTTRGPLLALCCALFGMVLLKKTSSIGSTLAICCLALSLLGWLVDVNALGHLSLVILSAGLFARTSQAVVWALGTIIMLPACSQILKSFFEMNQASIFRWITAVICISIITIISLRKDQRNAIS